MDHDDAATEYETMRTQFILNRDHAVRNVARVLGIPGWEYRSTAELRPEVASLHPPLAQHLEAFLASHTRWQQFHDRRHADGRYTARPTPAEAEEFAGLVDRRQKACDALEAEQSRVTRDVQEHGKKPGS